MIGFILLVAICSAIFIFAIHQILDYLKDTLTVPKTIDLVNVTEKKYEEIRKTLNSISNAKSISLASSTTKINSLKPSPILENLVPTATFSGSDIHQQQQPNLSNSSTNIYAPVHMKNELKNFLKEI